jgi:hypothetical protein
VIAAQEAVGKQTSRLAVSSKDVDTVVILKGWIMRLVVVLSQDDESFIAVGQLLLYIREIVL